MFSFIKIVFNIIYNNYKFVNVIYYITSSDLNLLNIVEITELKKNIIDAGPICIKFMQWYLSNNIISHNKNIDNVFEDIFDDCPKHSLEFTKQLFNKDFNKHLYNIIDIDNLEIIGSGSIGQVYKTYLINGKTIAMKVKHPNINTIINNQKIIINILIYLQKYKFIRNYLNLNFDLNGFIKDLCLQINFKNEVFNCLKLKNNFKNNDLIIIPEIYYYSNNIIIYSYEEGIEFETLSIFKKQKIGLSFYSMLVKMVMYDNFIHGDLHKKNWKIRKTNNELKIILYDFGLCYYLISNDINKDIWISFEENNSKILLNNIDCFLNVQSNKISINDRKELENTIIRSNNKPFNEIIIDIMSFLKKKNIYANKTLFNILVTMILLQKIFIESDLIYKGKDCIIEKKKKILNKICDLIAFTNKYDCYKNINEHYNKRRINLLYDIKLLNNTIN